MSKRIKLDRPNDSGATMEGDETSAGPSNLNSSHQLRDSIGFEGMPIEMILRVFKEMPTVDVVKLRGGSQLVNNAIRLYIRNSMMDLRISGNDVLVWLMNKLKTIPLNREHLRLELAQGIYFIRYVLTEVELLFATVWRFRDDDRSWNELVTHLAPVIAEFERAISSQRGLETARFNRLLIYPHKMKEVFSTWEKFLLSMDGGLEEKLENLRCRKTPFEIKVIDLLMSSPQFNSQLALKRWVNSDPKYDVYAFFKTSTLRPVGQVPDVFNTVLTIDSKKRLLIKYLRETCQHVNMKRLSSYVNDISILESSARFLFTGSGEPSTTLNRLQERYENATGFPYVEVLTNCMLNETERCLYEEQYIRCADENLAFTNLQCVSVVPQQDLWNLPLAVPYLRGARRGVDHYATRADIYTRLNTSGFFPLAEGGNDPERALLIGSDEKPRFQLIIHYRESYVTAPSEIVINIGYDKEQCHLTFHNLTGEPHV